MILVIDNYDSFTYNLVQYMGQIEPNICVKKNDEVSLSDISSLRPSQIVLSPGPGTPERAGVCLDVIRTFRQKIPILGVCLGYQAIAMAYGGSLKQAPKLYHGKTSRITHNGSGLFEGVDSPIEVMRYHSWIVDEETLPKELSITARTEDGIPMGLSHDEDHVIGVQFHPESILTPSGMKILKNFFVNCRHSHER